VADFERLKRNYGVNWAIVQSPAQDGLLCPYENKTVSVCRID